MAANFLAPHPCRPSRIDIAFDFACEPDFMADDLVPHYAAWAASKGITLGISGHGGVNSQYVGSPSSDRRVRTYRRDLKDRVASCFLGAELRIELVLRREQAVAWWSIFQRSKEEALAAAAWHVHEMTGLHVQESMHAVPPFVMPECASEADAICQFLRQHGDRVSSWITAGIPLLELAQEYAANATNRMRVMRLKRRQQSLAQWDIDELQAVMRRLILV
jgi:hypothetical protein